MPRIILAPLQGVTTARYRTLFAAHFKGCQEAMAPFISTPHGNPPPLRIFKDILPENNRNGMALIPQLLSKDGNDFSATAKIIHKTLGYPEINWNIGCPSGTVTAKGRGAGILPHLDVIDRFLETVCKEKPFRLSVKMRLGFKNAREWEALVPVLNRYPIHEITIHARTGTQQYKGAADTAMFGELYGALEHPVVYNGDITSVAFARNILTRFPKVSGLMIGRGLIANPLLADSIQTGIEAPPAAVLAAIRGFYNVLLHHYARALQGGALLGCMKELVKYWGPRLSPEERPVRNVLRATSLKAFQERMDQLRP